MNSDYNYDDIKSEVSPKDNILGQLSGLAMDAQRQAARVARLQEELSAAEAELKHTVERSIPELMDAADMAEYTTKDGVKIKIAEAIRGSISKDNAEKAFKWLEEHNHADLVKREFVIRFGKNEEAWAKKFQADLAKRKQKLACDVKRAVHPSTLASFLKNQLEAGTDIPVDLFGVFRQRVAKIEIK
jgi:hypothetical protein